MTIILETDDRLIMRERNVMGFVFGILFVVGGAGSFLFPSYFSYQPPLWVGIFCLLIGGWAILSTSITTIACDHISGTMTIRRRSLVMTRLDTFNIKDMKSIGMRSKTQSTMRNRGGSSYILEIELNTGVRVPLNSNGTGVLRILGKQIDTSGSLRDLGKKLADFMHVPFEVQKAMSLADVMSRVQATVTQALEEKAIKESGKDHVPRGL